MSLSNQLELLPQKYVTIATDVSCSGQKEKIMTWACYIRYNGGVIKRSGVFKERRDNTPIGETLALANALTIAYKSISDWSESRIIIHNECSDIVLRPLLTKGGKIRKRDEYRAAAIVDVSLPILAKAQSWELRDITAHYKKWQESDNPAKYAINRWCDSEARRLMKTIRNKEKKARKKLVLED